MSLADMSKYFLYAGIATPVVMGIFFYCIFKNNGDNSTEMSAVKNYLNKDSWQGEIIASHLESCRQTNTRYGNDFFFDVDFYLPGDTRLHTAKALVQPGQMHLLRKGMGIKVKKGRKNQLAVVEMDLTAEPL
ncbi:hypothetical protein ACN2W4_02140 [Serratia marcescens]|uniref:hypothetical protein n=1 Tax=Serratia TaxID=613 RepID=UPI00157237CE|nr:hypothetical protein [Serratia marcescens]MBI6131655.1 hypothetical protein [Serratia marcescens]MDN0029903.1 hypothetical protein [Serratia marcescens]NSM17923.1 hypothetical protein [Serratia marcescens]NSM47588.1 hypothetical protein [Serratia marcescens]